METLTTQPLQQAEVYNRELLYRAQQAQCFYDKGQKKDLKKNSGNRVHWRRFNALTPSTATLTEGVTPTATSLSISEVTATPSQYGAYDYVSDLVDLMGIDPVVMEAVQVFGQMAGESIETVTVNIMAAGTSVMYATGTARNQQAATNIITVDLLRKLARNLDRNNSLRFTGAEQNKKIGQGRYILFLHPSVAYDLQRDTEWKAVQQYSQPELLFSGSMGAIFGFEIIQSTLCPVFTGAGSGGADVYGSIAIAQHAYGVLDVGGKGKFETVVKQIGSGGTSDPLDQRGTVGYKSIMTAKILNDNFMYRLETGATA